MRRNRIVFALLLLLCTALANLSTNVVKAATSLSIVSPSNGQTYTGNSFTITGTATANSAVLLSKGGIAIAQTRADSSGNWSANLSNLPDGNNAIAVKAITNSGYAYFNTINEGFTTSKTNQLRLSDNAINPTAPYPVQHNKPWFGLLGSAEDDVFAHFSAVSDAEPAMFKTSNPVASTEATNYPADVQPNTGAFNSGATKYYSPNISAQTVSVIDSQTNAWVEDIALTANPVTAWLGPNGDIYVTKGNGAGFWIIDPTNDTIKQTVSFDCPSEQISPTVIFSIDRDYPYYYVTCFGGSNASGRLMQVKLADNSVVWNVETTVPYSNGILSGDHTRLYLTSSAAAGWGNEPNNNSDKVYVHNVSDGSFKKAIQATAGITGIAQSPDLQHIYAATPGTSFPLGTGFDVIDMLNDSLEHIATSESVAFVSTQPKIADVALSNVTVVLGAKTASGGGSLAETGALAVSITLLLGLILGSGAFVYYDYRKHKKPLVAEDANVHYTLLHHVKVVTIPLLKYRLSFQFESRQSSDGIHKF